MPVKEKIKCLCEGVFLVFLIGYLFYGNYLCGILFLPYLAYFYKNYKKEYFARIQEERLLQFKDGMSAINSALSAGYSIENSFKKALGELTVLYGGSADIVKGFEQINYKLGMNSSAEDALQTFAEFIDLEDARYFAEVFRYVKKSGGNMNHIIRRTTEIIKGRLEVKREIATLVSGRRMEQRVMTVIPFIIIVYIRFAAYDFIKPLYGNIAGIVTMTGCLIIYAAAVRWAKIIMNIEV